MEVKQELKELKIKVDEHTKDITSLKVQDASIMQQIKDLCKSVDGLVTTLEKDRLARVSFIKWVFGIILTIVLFVAGIYFKK